MYKIGVLIGSLRQASWTKKVAHYVADLFPNYCEVTFFEIGDLPIYNQDFDEVDSQVPDKIQSFRELAKAQDAFLFVTPEYNRSVPGGLKNALDIGSRPKEHSVWTKKPAAIISVSPSRISAFGANHHLRQSLVFFNMPVVQQPEAYIGDAASLFDDRGQITNDSVDKILRGVVDGFIHLIKIHS